MTHVNEAPREPGPLPVTLPGHEGGPYAHRPELLTDPAFWTAHLYSFASGEAAEDALAETRREVGAWTAPSEEGTPWPVFVVPLADGHRLYVVVRIAEGDEGVDYLLHHPSWERAELITRDDGHFSGPGLSWPELVAAADSGSPGGSTSDPHARLLLLLPAYADGATPEGAVERVGAALGALVGPADPGALAAALLSADPECPEEVTTWSVNGDGVLVNDAETSCRNPAGPFALPAARLARVARALTP
ncbi:hypothetical protein ACN20G_00865 [Streptomyces sp. BI20]|uniref:hypothetical protein n=1 Tax=Streptomyces sp. BI20 TaxID=3403460 RepID=UPI003C727926